MNTWVNFKELREKLDFQTVLQSYGVEVKRTGDQHHGFCPLPSHAGNKNSPSFSANLTRGIFQCFGCGAKGNVLEFAAHMEKVDLKDGAAFCKLALAVRQKFCPELGDATAKSQKTAPPKAETASPEENLPIVVNAPLNFELKGLDPQHPYLHKRGFQSETIAKFGLGFCSRGLFKARVAIPLHDHAGKLVGYAGRVVDDATITEDNPRYRFPSKRKRDGKLFEFHKSAFLYSGFRIQTPADDLIIVEGFTAVWWLSQNGWPYTVAAMGADCSEEQAKLIVALSKPTGRVWVVPDGDEAGRRFAQSVLLGVSPHRFVRWVKLNEDCQPTDLSAAQLKARFTM